VGHSFPAFGAEDIATSQPTRRGELGCGGILRRRDV
jgi:hypothetical protein